MMIQKWETGKQNDNETLCYGFFKLLRINNMLHIYSYVFTASLVNLTYSCLCINQTKNDTGNNIGFYFPFAYD